jgi:sialate O-acetylesterase
VWREHMDYRGVDRRWFLRAAGCSAMAGVSATGWSHERMVELDQAIWTSNSDKADTHPYPGDREADIWVFSGQSNSQGWGMLKAPIEPDPRILFFDADNQWIVAREPLNPRFTSWVPDSVRENILLQRTGVNYPSGASAEIFTEEMERQKVVLGGVGPGLAFAKHLVKFLNRPLGLVYCGVGGSPIKSWEPSAKNSNYAAMIQRISMVGGRIKGLIWYQGESDAMTPGADKVYEAALLRLIDAVRKDTNIPQLPVLCVQLGRFVWNYDSHAESFERIRDIQRRLPTLRPGVHTVSALDLPLEDAAHISFEGQQRLGRRLAEIALGQVYQLPDHGSGISLKAIEVLQSESRRPMVRVQFSGVSGKLTAAGVPTGFALRIALPAQEPTGPAASVPLHTIYRVDIDPVDPAAVILGVFDNALINSGGAKFHGLNEPFSIIYGPGTSPYVNIVDEKDIPIPAFGPVEVNT